MVEQEFLTAFKAVFVYQARKKFGLAENASRFGRIARPLVIPLYVFLLYLFTRNHYTIPLMILTFIGCAWLSAIAMDSIRRIYHIRSELVDTAANPGKKRFREFEEFSFREQCISYLISALVLTGVFATGMFIIVFLRTGAMNPQIFMGMLSIPLVMLLEFKGVLAGHG
ncbi:MAG TPA: hypothetical protein ENN68_06585 [Methanomicrobia archaeon]|nr:hypothetical protein [Methanomicrobia archaeon]